MDIDQARLEKAREIVASRCESAGHAYLAAAIRYAQHDGDDGVQSALAALALCNWQPPEDPDERAAYEIYKQEDGVCAIKWAARHSNSIYRVALAAFKAGKQSTNGDK